VTQVIYGPDTFPATQPCQSTEGKFIKFTSNKNLLQSLYRSTCVSQHTSQHT